MSKMIDNQGNTLVNVTESALPSGAATEVKQDTGNTSLASIDTKTPALSGGRVPVDGSGVTQPVSDGGSSLTVDGTVAVTNSDLTTLAGAVKAEDAASANGQTGIPAMAVRKATPANTSGADGDYENLQVSAGRLWVDASGKTLTVDGSGVTQPVSDGGGSLTVDGAVTVTGDAGAATAFLPVRLSDGTNFLTASQDATHDSAAASTGPQVMGVAGATAPTDVSADGDSVRLWALRNGTLAVNLRDASGVEVSVGGGTQYSEDTASTAADKVTMAGVVRKDTAATLVDTDGDRTQLQVDSNGALRVTGGGGGTQYNIDDVASATATGTVALVVRKDSAASLAGSDGDVTGLQVDASGALRVTGGGGGTEYTEDVASAADPVGGMLMAVRKDTLAAITSADGDNIAARATNKGELYVKHVDAISVNALPAGTNNIGDVDVLTLPSIPAGTNNIGDVDVLTVPADPFGANADAVVAAGAAGSISAKLRRATQGLEDLKTGIVLAAGTNAIGKLAANSGVDIGDVDVTTLGGQSPAFNSGARSSATLRTTIATDDVIALEARATGNGATPFKLNSAASTNATSVKASAGQVYMITASNINAAVRYLKFYNKASAPTVGTDTPVLVFAIPGNTAGAGTNIPVPAAGLAFSTGIAFALTTGAADSDAGAVAANDIIVNLGYK